MERKRALGKGIEALFDSGSINEQINAENIDDKSSVVEIDVNLIDNNIKQPRKAFDEEKLQELADSIKEHGVVQPIIVTRRGERYLIVAGERRYRATRIAGLKKVPAIVREMAENEVLEIALIENIQREDLNPIEEAIAIRFIMQQQQLTQEQVAQRLGKKRATVTNLLRLLNLPESIHEYIRSGELQTGHAKVLLSAKEEARETLAEQAAKEGWSVQMLEAKILGERKNPDTKTRKTREDKRDPYLRDAESEMRKYTGGKVRINGDQSKGKIVIEYYTQEMLEAIYGKICQS